MPCPSRRREAVIGADTQGRSHMTTEAEIGAMLPLAKECQEPWEDGRGKERFFPGAFRGITALPIP